MSLQVKQDILNIPQVQHVLTNNEGPKGVCVCGGGGGGWGWGDGRAQSLPTSHFPTYFFAKISPEMPNVG